MLGRIIAAVKRTFILAPALKGVAYASTTTAFFYPKLFWLFASIAAISGAFFYIILGAAALGPFIRGLRRLGRACKVGELDQEGNLITRHDCWF